MSKINNTVIKVLNPEHGKKVEEYFYSLGFDTSKSVSSKYRGVINGIWDACDENYSGFINLKVIELPTTEQAEYEKQSFVFDQVTINAPKHYDNTNGSLYKFAQDHGLNAWEMDIVKRVVRCRKKGNWLDDLQKTQFLIDLYISEFKDR